MEKQFDIVALGEILIDFTCQGRDENGQNVFVQNPGGAPANVVVSASRLGAKTAFLGKAGKDMHGEFLKSVLNRENVNTQGMILDEEHFTTLAFVNIQKSGERTFSFARKPGADTQIRIDEIDHNILDNTRIFHVGSLSLTNQPSRETTFYAVKRARINGSIISYDPNYRKSLWKSEDIAIKYMRSLIPYVDIMKLSDEETELLTGYKDIEKAAKALYAQGIKVAAITLGSRGVYAYCKDGGIRVDGLKSMTIDTNGAGDSFWGGFLYQLHKCGKRPEKLGVDELKGYLHFGNATASLCVEKRGAIPAMPYRTEVEQRLKICKRKNEVSGKCTGSKPNNKCNY